MRSFELHLIPSPVNEDEYNTGIIKCRVEMDSDLQHLSTVEMKLQHLEEEYKRFDSDASAIRNYHYQENASFSQTKRTMYSK